MLIMTVFVVNADYILILLWCMLVNACYDRILWIAACLYYYICFPVLLRVDFSLMSY